MSEDPKPYGKPEGKSLSEAYRDRTGIDIYTAFLNEIYRRGFKPFEYRDLWDIGFEMGLIDDAEREMLKSDGGDPRRIEGTSVEAQYLQLTHLFKEMAVKKNSPFLGRSEFFPTLESYFHYVELQELKESREASVSARRFSTWAIIISLISLAASGVFFYLSQSPLATDLERNEILLRIDEKVGSILSPAEEEPN